MFKLIIGVIASAVIVIVVMMYLDPKVSSSTNGTSVVNSSNVISLNSDQISVAVEGEVNKTGTYVLEEGATMSDLLDAAGGITDYADTCAYYESAELEKGMTYFIPSKYDTSNVCTLVEIEKVNINEDDAETLTSISVISSTLANSIVSYRVENSNYQTIEDLLDVYGIGNATYRKIRNYVTLHA